MSSKHTKKLSIKSTQQSMNAGENTQDKTFELYKRLLKEVAHLWPMLLWAAIGSMLFSISDASMIYLINPILGHGFGAGGSITDKSADFLKLLGVGMILLLSLRSVGGYLSNVFIGKLGQKVVYLFRLKIYNRFMDLPASFFDKFSSGNIISRLLYNVDQVTNATSNAIMTIAQDGVFVIGLVIVMFVSSWQLSLFLIIIGPVLGVFISFINKKFRAISRNTQASMGSVTHLSEETIRNYKEIRVFGGQNNRQENFANQLNYTYSQQIRTIALDSLSSPVIQIIASLILALSLFTIATFGVSKGDSGSWVTAGSFASFFAAAAAILKPIKNLTKVNVTIQQAVAATEDIYFILDYPAEQETGDKTIDNIKGSISIRDLHFSFGDKKILNGVNMDINPGEVVALVGKSGSGKTTLTNILSRFYNQDSGDIFIDDISTADLKLSNLRSHISMVSQNVHLFDDTIYNNVAFGLPDKVSDDDVLKALEKANALDFVNKLSDGFDSPAGNNGSNLSGGQRQRISIARALLKNAPILIFDEATSALDNESERVVQQALENLTNTCTTLIIAHRLSTVEKADKIVVMDEGRVVEFGKHDNLLNNNGLYSRLYYSGLN